MGRKNKRCLWEVFLGMETQLNIQGKFCQKTLRFLSYSAPSLEMDSPLPLNAVHTFLPDLSISDQFA